MKSPSELLWGKEHNCDLEEAKRLHVSASSLEKKTFCRRRIQTQNLPRPSVRSNAAKLFSQLEKMQFQLV